ncbi:HPP family protein [Sphingomonas crusticola]|uniref:HPP family protein n=1 Tax=Sphingomonas crusticola TaxID=1697973 RepID=UPI001F0866A8|nr:HPP family protein [Sphingomonas crusticola]
MTQKTARSTLPLLAPLLAGASSRDRLIASVGALLAITVVAALCHRLLPLAPGLPYLAAPLGASAVLVFAVPASPLSQPWPVIGGNIASAIVGTVAAQLIPRPEIAAGVAVAAAILAMSLLRCLHAPGGGTALVTAMASPAIAASGYGFALLPIAADAILLVAVAWLFHLVSGHSYPHRPATKLAPAAPALFHRTDIDYALADMGDAFDISRDDLDLLLTRAEYHAAAR